MKTVEEAVKAMVPEGFTEVVDKNSVVEQGDAVIVVKTGGIEPFSLNEVEQFQRVGIYSVLRIKSDLYIGERVIYRVFRKQAPKFKVNDFVELPSGERGRISRINGDIAIVELSNIESMGLSYYVFEYLPALKLLKPAFKYGFEYINDLGHICTVINVHCELDEYYIILDGRTSVLICKSNIEYYIENNRKAEAKEPVKQDSKFHIYDFVEILTGEHKGRFGKITGISFGCISIELSTYLEDVSILTTSDCIKPLNITAYTYGYTWLNGKTEYQILNVLCNDNNKYLIKSTDPRHQSSRLFASNYKIYLETYKKDPISKPEVEVLIHGKYNNYAKVCPECDCTNATSTTFNKFKCLNCGCVWKLK